ncbi:hypothetical protein [Robiginitalea biformata]|uniref:Uncharacterized protein n=1 Tax=Robiginitalea biformata (strain ATCC BAA-864 / DSM 15991 / KCTC 12146 / HTCC2501) TaxID=313596 RepID=A4CGP1_ROBBH|nr:hypothetical protein [Robiginitalea biformata]EAR16099.1 hypothetical protein RB2501_04355 [Robiginitalea biformata HTCC2501]
MKPVLFNNVEFKEIMQYVQELVKQSGNIPDEETRELTAEILKYFDLMHREPLSRMLQAIERSYPDLKDTLKQDYTINTLLELYDFENTNLPDKQEKT